VILDEHREKIRSYLVMAEGLRLKPYTDTVGKLTIGIGRNLTDVGISALEAYALLDHDIDRAITALVGRYPWFADEDPVRQAAMVELEFNMGSASFAGFHNTLAAWREKDYPKVVDGLRASKWFRQVQKSRSARILQMVSTGIWP
jgi:lysozyme